MLNSTLLFVFTILLYIISNENVLGNEVAKYELLRRHEWFKSRKGFGVTQQLDEELCELQNNLTASAIMFMDATGKVPAGIFVGNMNHFGQYEQCLAIEEVIEDVNIRGKYCMMHVNVEIENNPNIPEGLALGIPGFAMSGMFGVCVPDACPATFDANLMGLNITSEELYCREANDKPFAVQDIVAIVIFAILGLLLIVSTGYHLFSMMKYNQDVSHIAKSFSVHHNMTRLTNVPKNKSPLSCINGIRALSMLWVLVGHTYITIPIMALENPANLFEWLESFGSTWIIAAPLAVDTFFYMAAFLLTWSILKKFDGPVAFAKSVPLLYLNRYLRLTPTVAAVMLLQVSFFNHVSDGPDWRPVAASMDHCLESWWVNLLYLQNYLRPTGMCLGHSWYLAVDMQLYLAAPVLIVFLLTTVKFAITASTVFSIGSLGAALGYCFYYNFGVQFGINPDWDLPLFTERYYINTIPRSPPFVLGIVVAYIMFSMKKRNVTVSNKLYMLAHWVLTAALLILPLYGSYTTISHDLSQETINFFNAWHRAAWTLGVGGIIFASMQGFGGPIGWFLGLDFWTTPARLSYSMYLIHYPIMYALIASSKSPSRFTDAVALVRFFSDLGLSILAAVLLHLVVEAPFAELCNVLVAKLSGKKKENEMKSIPKNEASSTSSVDIVKNDLIESPPSVQVVSEKENSATQHN